jgi:hypothetical protein
MRRPDFLIIGAMKAGTTTLHRDLSQHPQIFLSDPKEPNDLVSDDVLTDKGLQAYTGLFAGARPDQLCGEASTTYTREPRHTGAAARALQVCGANLKLIYVVRDPFERAVSHYRYAFLRGRTNRAPEVELIENPEYAQVSDYARQLAPWRSRFGDDAILIVNFRDYIKARKETVTEVLRFLGLEATTIDYDVSQRFNASDDVKVTRGFVEKLTNSPAFQRRLKPLLGPTLRRFGKAALLRRGDEPPPVPVDTAFRQRFEKSIAPESANLAKMAFVSQLSSRGIELIETTGNSKGIDDGRV